MDKPKAILFDLDGTIIDSDALFFEATRSASAQNGIMISHEMFINTTIKKGVSVFENVDSIRKRNRELIQQQRDKIYCALLSSSEILLPDALDVLRNLKKSGLIIGLGTGSKKKYFNSVESNIGLQKYFDAVVTRDDVKRIKPFPDIYQKLCSILNVKPCESLVVEDTEKGILAGKDTGCHVVAIPNKYYKEYQDYDRADMQFSDLLSFKKFILEILAS